MRDKMWKAFAKLCKEYGPVISFCDFEIGWDAAQAEQSAELERLRKDEELKASEASIACEALQEIIDLLPGSSVAQAKLIAVAAMTKRAAIANQEVKDGR